MRYKRSSPIARHFLSPKFCPFEEKSEFFNTHEIYRQFTSAKQRKTGENCNAVIFYMFALSLRVHYRRLRSLKNTVRLQSPENALEYYPIQR